jgi:hypothetical protein
MSPIETASLTIDSKLSISEYADLFGFPAEAVLAAVQAQSHKLLKPWYTFQELAVRWNMTPQNVYNVMREYDAKVSYFTGGKTRGKPQVSRDTVARIERQSSQLLEPK